ncbi:hypothetical protein B0F90DRAFT_1191195 [Multifurca ochricompacta]|uniref:DUF7330 domain-containing protein n=1 Tax=Multifurca ochricompacta TaxID=376703 RepID=A0AAD4M8B9_9AGAM|nr:hypothetical protein B0F90DRAFT_1191195 [Multifurca ochricompacta]
MRWFPPLTRRFDRPSQHLPAAEESPPPYSPLLQGSSLNPTPPSNHPPDLAPTNYLHVKEQNHSITQKVLLDMSISRPLLSALPVRAEDSAVSNLTLDSHNGSVSGEVWVLHPHTVHAGVHTNKAIGERVRLQFRSHNGAVRAIVHVHPLTVEPRPFLSIEARAQNGSVAITIPRSFRGQLTLHTDNGRVVLSPTLATCVSPLSNLNGTHTYFIGERPSDGWSKNGSVRLCMIMRK